MKTVALTQEPSGAVITLALTELELTTLAALVEQGQHRLGRNPQLAQLHSTMDHIADEFRSLLGHFELLVAND